MMGTIFCQYETPCGWCTRLNKECTEKGGCKPKKKQAVAVVDPREKLSNPVAEYVAKFAENHGISIAEAWAHPTVKAYAVAEAGFKSGIMNC